MSFIELLHLSVFGVVLLSSLLFGLIFVVRKKNSGKSAISKSRLSNLGILLQGASYPVVFSMMRSPFSQSFPLAADVVLLFMAGCAGIASVWLAYEASNSLGLNWSLTAKIVEGHKLVTGGVYGIVRHPIYTAMLLLLVSQALVFGQWMILVPALIVFAIGTGIRVHEEEKLLKEAFGEEYNQYSRRVPALIPGLKCCCGKD